MNKIILKSRCQAILLLVTIFPVLGFSQSQMVDPGATELTKVLFENLKLNMGKGVMFGHQDDLAYGVEWKAQKDMSDVKGACGHFPAIFGWELGKLGQRPVNIDSVDFVKFYNDPYTWFQADFPSPYVMPLPSGKK